MRADACRILASFGLVLAATLSTNTQAETDAQALTHAQTALDAHRREPGFLAPGLPFDARKCAAGKKMLSIPSNSANPFLQGIIEREKLAGRELGLTVQEWQNEGSPSQWAQGLEYARRNRFELVDLISGVDPKTVEPQIRAAAQSGVRVMVSHFYDPSQPVNPLVAASLPIGFNTVGKLLADWVILRTHARANVVLIVSDEVPPTAPLVAGFEQELAGHCPACRLTGRINVGVTEWGTKIRPALQSALLAHPQVNFVVPIYDSMAQFVIPAIQMTARQAQVKVATFNGTPFVLDYVRAGKVDMDIGESLDWIARATLDGYLRASCGLPVPKDLGVPFYIFDSSNVTRAGVPAQFDRGYGTDYLRGFRAAWMLPQKTQP